MLKMLAIFVLVSFFYAIVSSADFQFAQQNESISLIYERLEIEYANPKVWKGNITVRKHNRTSVKTDFFFESFKLITYEEADTEISFYKLSNNRYILANKLEHLNFCILFESRQLGLEQFMKNTNVPKKCPLPPGKYYMRDVTLSSDMGDYSLPPMTLQMVAGRGKMSTKLYGHGMVYGTLNFYYNLERVVKW